MKPPIGIGLDYARYLRRRIEAAGAKLEAVALRGWDPERGRVPRADASGIDAAVRAMMKVFEEHPPDPKRIDEVAGKVEKANARGLKVVGVPTREGLISSRYLVVQEFSNGVVDILRPSKTEAAAEKFANQRNYLAKQAASRKAEYEAEGRPIPGRSWVIKPGDPLPSGAAVGARDLGIRTVSGQPALPLDKFRQENLSLIRTLDEQSVDRLRGILEEADRKALRVEQVQVQIREALDVSKRHADLLARDQVLKFNGQLTEARQTAAGVTHYEWSTSGDERVRPSHAELDGTIQAWAEPPEVDEKTGRRAHPGGDFQCRCQAIPVV